MKYIFVFLLLALSYNCGAQGIRLNFENGKVGFETEDSSNKAEYKSQVIYDEIAVFVKQEFGGTVDSYYRFDSIWCDTEFIDIPIDVNDPSYTRTDTTVDFWHRYFPEKLIIAKKSGKWGLISNQGKIELPFEYDAIKVFPHLHASESGPLLLIFKNNGVFVLNQKMEKIISETLLNKYYPGPVLDQIKVLEMVVFKDQMLVMKNGKQEVNKERIEGYYSMLSTIGGKDTFYSPPYENEYCILNGESYNLLSLETGKLIYTEWKKHILIKFNYKEAEADAVIMDVSNKESIEKAQGIYMGRFYPDLIITFIPKP